MARKLYVAYGSNLNIPRMRMRCPGAKIVGTSEIPNHRLMFKGSMTGSYLTIEPCEGESVPVAVWEISPEHEAALDHYEGFPTFYYKKAMKLPIKSAKSGKTQVRETFVYIMHEERLYGTPSISYLNICAKGYDAFGFNKEKLLKAARDSGREAKR